MSLLELVAITKKQIDKNNASELNASDNDNKKYKVKAICDNIVYIRESKLDHHLVRLYYLIS